MTKNAFAPSYKITDVIVNSLGVIERARGFLQAAQISEEWIKFMVHRAFVREAHYSTHIEGTRLTLDQAEKLLEGKNVPDVDPDDKRELLNYRSAFDVVADYVKSGDPLTEGVIREIHKKLVDQK